MALRQPSAEETEKLAAQVALLRAAAYHARQVWPGRLGDTCAEWLIGEANCHEAVPETMTALGNLVDSFSPSIPDGEVEEIPTEMRLSISTLDAACDFARAVLSQPITEEAHHA